MKFDFDSLRELVRVFGDGEAEARVGPPKPRSFAGFWGEGLGEPEPETAGSSPGRRRGSCLSLLPGSAVRFRPGFDPAKCGAQQIYQHPHRSRMVSDRAAQNESVSRNWAGRVNHPRLGDEGEGEMPNDFNQDEY